MDKNERYFEEALKHLKIADHMINVTIPVVQDLKLLLNVFEEIHESIINSLKTFQELEKIEDLELFLNESAKKYNISKENIALIKEIKELHNFHKSSAIEFLNKEKIVILTDNLNTYSLDLTKIKHYLLLAKELILILTKTLKA